MIVVIVSEQLVDPVEPLCQADKTLPSRRDLVVHSNLSLQLRIELREEVPPFLHRVGYAQLMFHIIQAGHKVSN